MSDTVTIPKGVLLGFVQSWGAELAFDLGERLTCAEVEDLAELLRALGYPVIADEWIDAHADGDDEGDSHYRAPDDTREE